MTTCLAREPGQCNEGYHTRDERKNNQLQAHRGLLVPRGVARAARGGELVGEAGRGLEAGLAKHLARARLILRADDPDLRPRVAIALGAVAEPFPVRAHVRAT